jgi:opacity protein-like surface antigen
VSLRIEGQWQQIEGRTFGGCLLFPTCPSPPESHYRVADATANVVYSGVLAGPVRLYVIGGLGVYNERASGLGADSSTRSLTKFGLNGGVGAQFQLSHFAAFVEARYHNIFGAHAFGDPAASTTGRAHFNSSRSTSASCFGCA